MLYTFTFLSGAVMGKELFYAEYFEEYKNLLTEHQRGIFYDYYALDLSLGEIAENYGISRQSVNDCLKKAKEQLEFFESALHMSERHLKLVKFGEKLGGELEKELLEIIRD